MAPELRGILRRRIDDPADVVAGAIKYMSGGPKAMDLLLGGWQLNGTWSYMAGQPFTPSYRDCNSDRDTGWCRPDLVGDYSVSNPDQFGWFKTTSVPLTANGQTDGPWQRPQRLS